MRKDSEFADLYIGGHLGDLDDVVAERHVAVRILCELQYINATKCNRRCACKLRTWEILVTMSLNDA